MDEIESASHQTIVMVTHMKTFASKFGKSSMNESWVLCRDLKDEKRVRIG